MRNQEATIEEHTYERHLACTIQNPKIKGLVVGGLFAGAVIFFQRIDIVLILNSCGIGDFDQLHGGKPFIGQHGSII